jgi:DUF4097 and DUF4098 domain-containing protein YvlB
MKNIVVIPIYALLLLLCGCQVSFNTKGCTIHNGVNLKYSASVQLDGQFPGDLMDFNCGSTDFNLTATDDDKYNLTVEYMEFKPGDGHISINGSQFKLSADSKHEPLITRVTGTVPRSTLAQIATGSGNISLSGLNRSKLIDLRTGSGDISTSSCVEIRDFRLEAGSGDITVNDCSLLPLMKIRTGSGDITFTKVRDVTSLNAILGSGDVRVDNSFMKTMTLSTGSGDINMSDSKIGEFEGHTGSGDLNLSHTTIERRTFRSGSGKVFEENSAN